MDENAKTRLSDILHRHWEHKRTQIGREIGRQRADDQFSRAFVSCSKLVIEPSIFEIANYLRAHGKQVNLELEKSIDGIQATTTVNVTADDESWVVASLFARPHLSFVCDVPSRRVLIARSKLKHRSTQAWSQKTVPLHRLTPELVQGLIVDLIEELLD